MRSTYEGRAFAQIETQRNIVQGDATICSSLFGRACKGMWPHKTAEELAALSGCSVRAAAYQISGESEPSARSIHAIQGLWLKRN